MTIVSDFQNGVAEALLYGQQIMIKYYSTSYGAGSYYDDDIVLTQSGVDYWISGVVLPITNKQGSSDAVMLEQGKVIMDDTKLYVDGRVPTSGTLKFGLTGSPSTDGYYLLGEGVTKWDVNATPVLKKLYIRRLTNGSFMGEM